MLNDITVLDNIFVNEYLPRAKGDYVKVYVYGLSLASRGNHPSNSMDELSRALSISSEEVFEALQFLEINGLIEIASKSPLEISFISPRRHDAHSRKKYKPAKYAAFNASIQSLFPSRMLPQNELLEYYDAAESLGLPPETLLMIAAYCVNSKGQTIDHRYILTVARDWAKNGIVTPAEAEQKIKELELLTGDIRTLFSALGKKSAPEYSDKELLSKWKSRGFSFPAVIFAAKRCKKSGGMNKLDLLLEEYARLGIFTIPEMERYSERRDRLYSLAADINKRLGLYYESLDNVVETYTAVWIDMGFDHDALSTLAQHCMTRGLRRLSDMDALVKKFYKAGRLTDAAVKQYIDALIGDDDFIRKLFDILGIEKSVTKGDRDALRTWTELWGFSKDLILFSAESSKDRAYSLTYLNRILSDYREKGVQTVEKAGELAPAAGKSVSYPKEYSNSASKGRGRSAKNQKDYEEQREYTREELDALFADLDNIDKIDF